MRSRERKISPSTHLHAAERLREISALATDYEPKLPETTKFFKTRGGLEQVVPATGDNFMEIFRIRGLRGGGGFY